MVFAFAGCVGRPGMSEHVAVSANFLPYRTGQGAPTGGKEWAGAGVPYNFLCRMMLKQKSTAEAVAAAAAVKRMACLNYTIGDSQGSICCIETTPRDLDVLHPREEFIVHANSYHSPKYGGLSEKAQEEGDPRAFHARELLHKHRDRLDRHALASVQTSHFAGQSTGVCVHNKLQDRDGITLLSFIARVGAGEMWAACGPPCEHEFVRFRLPRRMPTSRRRAAWRLEGP
jgi:hypothetical protein